MVTQKFLCKTFFIVRNTFLLCLISEYVCFKKSSCMFAIAKHSVSVWTPEENVLENPFLPLTVNARCLGQGSQCAENSVSVNMKWGWNTCSAKSPRSFGASNQTIHMEAFLNCEVPPMHCTVQ